MLGTGIIATAVNIYSYNFTSDILIYYALTYFCAMLIATPLSGGHLNPAITVGVWIAATGASKAEFVTMALMILAQFFGTLFGVTAARSMRF